MAARSSRAMSLRRRPTSSSGPSRGPRAPASDLRRALCSTRPTDPATSRPSGPINGARPMHSRRPPPCREWCALAPSAASPCKLSPSLCSSGTLTRPRSLLLRSPSVLLMLPLLLNLRKCLLLRLSPLLIALTRLLRLRLRISRPCVVCPTSLLLCVATNTKMGG